MMIIASAIGIDCASREASLGVVGKVNEDPARLTIADKVDVLLVVDDSASMDDKRELLAKTIPDFVDRLLHPNCLDANGKSVGRVADGLCTIGTPEFRPVGDLHIGITGTSLPIPNSSSCDERVARGGRFNTIGKDYLPNARAATSGFLSWKRGDSESQLKSDTQDIVSGMARTDYGCGYEAPLESWYRLLVEPDPYLSVSAGGPLQYDGVDEELLAARKAFMRPDSLLVIASFGDEDDVSLNIGAFGGSGWRITARPHTNYPPTATCATDPFGPACTSCWLASQNCEAIEMNVPNTLLFEPKRYLGVNPLFPISRYAGALTSFTVPSLARTFDPNTGNPIQATDCVNPIFAGELPSDASGDLCHLKAGVRSPSLVRFAVIGGIPRALIANDKADPNSLEKGRLSTAEWLQLTGQDPEHYNYAGADPHMIPSRTARAGLAVPTSSNVADPMHGREHDLPDQLQAACAYTLPTPLSDQYALWRCNPSYNNPLCEGGEQVRASAEPPTRLLTVARTLGDRSIVSSICPAANLTSPQYPEESAALGFRPLFKNIGDSMATNLAK